MINKIIKDWVGEDSSIADAYSKRHNQQVLWSDIGYNQAKAELRESIPQLTERIVEIIESHRDRDLPEEEKHQCNVLINDILKDLK